MQADWLKSGPYASRLDEAASSAISRLKPQHVPKGTVMFRPGDMPRGFVLVLGGTIAVYLTGRSGREILLYEVGAGQTCVQTTVGLLGEQAYSGEAVAETDCVVVLIPLSEFQGLMATSGAFRKFVFEAFGNRLSEITQLLEQVAFVKIEARLAAALIERADTGGTVELTHQELAAIIGSAREVVSRRLEALRAANIVELTRGTIRICDRDALAAIARGQG